VSASLPNVRSLPLLDPGQEGEPLVQIRDLSKTFVLGKSLVRQLLGRRPAHLRALDGVNLDIFRGEALGLVGESGCGKTTLGRCILRLHEPDRGQVLYEGQDVLQMGPGQLRQMRRRMQIVFQDPDQTLDPRMRIGSTLGEVLRAHRIVPRERVRDRDARQQAGLGEGELRERLDLAIGNPVRRARIDAVERPAAIAFDLAALDPLHHSKHERPQWTVVVFDRRIAIKA